MNAEAKQVICEDVAREEIKSWSLQFGQGESPEPAPSLLRAVMGGRILLKDGTFHYRLISPIRLENGEVVDELKIKEPTAAQVRDASKQGSEMDITLRLLSYVSGQSLGVVERLGSRDLIVVGALFGFFG